MPEYDLYLIERWLDPRTKAVVVEDEPYFLRLSYETPTEAEEAKEILETIYPKDSIRVHVSERFSEVAKTEFDDLSEEELDILVHDLKGAEAADINNAGRESQIHYLTHDKGKK